MNKARNFNSIFIFVLILLVFVVILEYGSGLFSNNSNSYNLSSLQGDVESSIVRNVVIMPNAETPTGSVRVSFNNGNDDVIFYSTDVTAIEAYLVGKEVGVEVKDIPSDSIAVGNPCRVVRKLGNE